MRLEMNLLTFSGSCGRVGEGPSDSWNDVTAIFVGGVLRESSVKGAEVFALLFFDLREPCLNGSGNNSLTRCGFPELGPGYVS